MANMDYCMFEKTHSDLQDCYDKLTDKGGVEQAQNDANKYEKPYIRKLVELCKSIADEFGENEGK